MQNRYLWNRFKHEEQLIEQQGTSANAKWLWHGTSKTDPVIVCDGVDGVDFRMVRICFVCECAVVWWCCAIVPLKANM